MKKMLPVGKISKLFGGEGRVQINLYDSFYERSEEEPLYVRIDTLAVPLFLNYFDRKGKQKAVVGLDDIDTIRRAEELIGHHVYIEQRMQPDIEREDGELYMDQMVGYRVKIYDQEMKPLAQGEMSAYIDSEFNPLFEVELNKKRVLIPAVDEFIHAVDSEKHIIELKIPEGLLEL